MVTAKSEAVVEESSQQLLERQKGNLRRITMLVAIANGLQPTPQKIVNLFMAAVAASTSPTTPTWLRDAGKAKDRIATYLGKKVNGTVQVAWCADDEVRATYLKLANKSLFGNDEGSYFQSFDVDLDKHHIWQTHRDAVEARINGGAGLQAVQGVLMAVDYYGADPADPGAVIEPKNNRRGTVLKAHLLYHTPLAARLWDGIKDAKSYHEHYKQCQLGLVELLSNQSFIDLLGAARLVLNLGAGSPEKDLLILRAMAVAASSGTHGHVPVYCWVDASQQMLFRTLHTLFAPKSEPLPDVRKIALAQDFESPEGMKALYSASFPNLPRYQGRKVFFILGYTLSNLSEESFFSTYSDHCDVGDVIVFPIQFIPDECMNDPAKLNAFMTSVLKLYNFPEGSKLAAAGLSSAENFRLVGATPDPTIERSMWRGEPDSLRLHFQANMEDIRVSGKAGCFTLTTAESFRHYEQPYLQYLKSQGFEPCVASEMRHGVKTLAVKFVGKPSTPAIAKDPP